MLLRYRWSAVGTSSLLAMLSLAMSGALLDNPGVDLVIGILGVTMVLVSLVQLGASFMMPDDVRCPKCGEGCRLKVRMSGVPELRSIVDGER
ncbi:hypothetical protein ACSRUE_09265 [Sorangium sp. KYC3313]|uniref:hypothetical protein n=1 Tax=unclassified Sorangium TaxID=2621164 RepID=UPI003F5C0F80